HSNLPVTIVIAGVFRTAGRQSSPRSPVESGVILVITGAVAPDSVGQGAFPKGNRPSIADSKTAARRRIVTWTHNPGSRDAHPRPLAHSRADLHRHGRGRSSIGSPAPG